VVLLDFMTLCSIVIAVILYHGYAWFTFLFFGVAVSCSPRFLTCLECMDHFTFFGVYKPEFTKDYLSWTKFVFVIFS
jgi:hypothetical protein